MYQAVYDAILHRAGVDRKAPESQRESTKLVGDLGFQQRLEAHLVDVKSGKAWRSSGVNRELQARHTQNGRSLAEMDPKALRMYVGLISGMEYAHQARLASTVFSMNRGLDALRDAGEQLKEISVPKTPPPAPPSEPATES